MRGSHRRRKFGNLEVDKRRRNQNRYRGGRSGAGLEHEGVDAANLLRSPLVMRPFISRFGIMIVRRHVRVNQRGVMCMMRVRGSRRRVHMRVRQHGQAYEDCENGGRRPQPTHHPFYRSASPLDCQAPTP
jgi:hypothetical protein